MRFSDTSEWQKPGTGIKADIMRYFLFSLLLIVFNSCNLNSFNADLSSTPTSGNIKISVDESYQPLMQAELNTFMSLYPLAEIQSSYKPEADVVHDLLNDSVKVIVVNKKLDDAALNVFKSKNIFPVTTRIAVDAVAVIVNKNNPRHLFTLAELRKVITGEIKTWRELDQKANPDSILIVFDNNNSSNARFIKERFLANKNFPSNCFAVKSNAEVINYVKENNAALGIIALNWISDPADSVSHRFRNTITVVALKDEKSLSNNDYYEPYQAYIALDQYPLSRSVYMISREGHAGTGTGFVSFVSGDQGQRIVRLSGLLPATMPVRIIRIN